MAIKDPETILKDFYNKVIQCNCASCLEWGLERNFSRGIIPRSFYTKNFRSKPILVVSVNPGRGPPDEFDSYRRASDKIAAEYAMVEENYSKGIRYLNCLHEAICIVLNLKPDADIFDYISFTNIVKCQCNERYGTFSQLSNPEEIMDTCYNRWLKEELSLLHPRLIFTYGKALFEFLDSYTTVKVINLPRPGNDVPTEQWREKLRRHAKRLAWVRTPEYLPITAH